MKGRPLTFGNASARRQRIAALSTCINGAGSDNTCQTATLGGATVRLFGLNTDNIVNDDDRFYAGFTCNAGTAGPQPNWASDARTADGSI